MLSNAWGIQDESLYELERDTNLNRICQMMGYDGYTSYTSREYTINELWDEYGGDTGQDSQGLFYATYVGSDEYKLKTTRLHPNSGTDPYWHWQHFSFPVGSNPHTNTGRIEAVESVTCYSGNNRTKMKQGGKIPNFDLLPIDDDYTGGSRDMECQDPTALNCVDHGPDSGYNLCGECGPESALSHCFNNLNPVFHHQDCYGNTYCDFSVILDGPQQEEFIETYGSLGFCLDLPYDMSGDHCYTFENYNMIPCDHSCCRYPQQHTPPIPPLVCPEDVEISSLECYKPRACDTINASCNQVNLDLPTLNFCYGDESVMDSMFGGQTHFSLNDIYTTQIYGDGDKVVVLYMSTSWCGPCYGGIEGREVIFNQFINSHPDNFMMVEILADVGQPHSCEQWGNQGTAGIMPIVHDDSGDFIWNGFFDVNPTMIPKVVVIDKNGRLIIEDSDLNESHIPIIENALNDNSPCDFNYYCESDEDCLGSSCVSTNPFGSWGDFEGVCVADVSTAPDLPIQVEPGNIGDFVGIGLANAMLQNVPTPFYCEDGAITYCNQASDCPGYQRARLNRGKYAIRERFIKENKAGNLEADLGRCNDPKAFNYNPWTTIGCNPDNPHDYYCCKYFRGSYYDK